MNNVVNSFIDDTVQCWGCPIFDRLFSIVSDAAAAVYDQFAFFCGILFCVLFAFYVLNVVWQNFKSGAKETWYEKSIQSVFINAIVALAFLGMGITMPRFVTSVTFEPVAQMTVAYTQAVLQTDTETVTEQVTYQPMKMRDDGFFRPQLRDSIVLLMKTTITQFQNYIKLGFGVMENAFSWQALTGIGALIRHIIVFMLGLFIAYSFIKFFVRFMFYFADIILAMTFFAFFFPLSLAMVAFRGAQNVPSWMSNLGKNVGTDQIKNLINAIVALGAAVLTYTVMMGMLAKFFASQGQSAGDVMQMVLAGDALFTENLSDDNFAQLSVLGCVALIYVLNFIIGRIPDVTKTILSTFNVGTENKASEQLANDAMTLTTAAINVVKKAGQTIISGGEKKDDKK